MGYVLISIGTIYEVFNIGFAITWLTSDHPKTTVLALPPILILVGISITTLRYKLVFAVATVVIHLIVNGLIPWLGGAYRFYPDERIEWRNKRRSGG